MSDATFDLGFETNEIGNIDEAIIEASNVLEIIHKKIGNTFFKINNSVAEVRSATSNNINKTINNVISYSQQAIGVPTGHAITAAQDITNQAYLYAGDIIRQATTKQEMSEPVISSRIDSGMTLGSPLVPEQPEEPACQRVFRANEECPPGMHKVFVNGCWNCWPDNHPDPPGQPQVDPPVVQQPPEIGNPPIGPRVGVAVGDCDDVCLVAQNPVGVNGRVWEYRVPFYNPDEADPILVSVNSLPNVQGMIYAQVLANKSAYFVFYSCLRDVLYNLPKCDTPIDKNDVLVGSGRPVEVLHLDELNKIRRLCGHKVDGVDCPKVPKPPVVVKDEINKGHQVRGCDELPFAHIGIFENEEFPISHALGLITKDNQNSTPSWLDVLNIEPLVFKPAGGLVDPITISLPRLGDMIADLIRPAVKELDGFIKSAMAGQGAQGLNTLGAVFSIGLLRFADKWTGLISPNFTEPIRQYIDYHLGYKIFGSVESLSAYLAGEITYEQFLCYWKAEGNLEELAKPWVEANETKLSGFEAATLFRRGAINEEEYKERIRKIGFFKGDASGDYLKLTEQIPPLSDLLRFMVRDVVNKKVVDDFGMDDGFGDNWQGKLAEFGEQQGLHPDYAKYAWRAHWSIPSPTQLFEMFHRLERLPEGDKNRVTLDQVRMALKQQDILPFWIDKILAVSFSPLTRTDTARAFNLGVLDDQGVVNSYLDQGYDKDNANVLLKYITKEKVLHAVRHEKGNHYKNGAITRVELTTWLDSLGYTPEQKSEVLSKLMAEAEAETNAACIEGIKERYFHGEIDEQQTKNELLKSTADIEIAVLLQRRWECMKLRRHKSPTYRQLCEWYDLGMIDEAEFMRRMTNLGVPYDNSLKMINACRVKSLKKKEVQDLRRLVGNNKQADREKKRSDREERVSTESLIKAQKRAEHARKSRSALNKTLLDISQRLADKFALDMDFVFRLTKDFYKTAQNELKWPTSDILLVMTEVSQLKELDGFDGYMVEVYRVLNEGLETLVVD